MATKKTAAPKANPFQLLDKETLAKVNKKAAESEVHVYGKNGFVCETEPRGQSMPRGRSPLEIVLDASDGFVPLWAKDTIIRWTFREQSLQSFARPAAAKAEIRRLFAAAVLQWGDAAPVKFKETRDAWDFEIVMRPQDNCSGGGCVLASAFFPDSGRHQFYLYPKMFTQDDTEQVETFIHEIGHIFGLRHFFAKISETQWKSEIFGTHKPFSIMNYGADSKLADYDKSDLKALYKGVWDGSITNINGTPVHLVKPYHTL